MPLWFEDYLIKNFGAALMGSDFTRMMFTTFVVPKTFLSINMFPDKPGVAPDAIDFIAPFCPKKRLFVVTDGYAVRFCDRITNAFEKRYGFATHLWSGALPEVPLESIDDCVAEMAAFEPDLIMGVGGGSVIDSAKVAWLRYERPDMKKIEEEINPIFPLGLRKKALLAGVPTTSGTGSECSPTAMVTDTASGMKIAIVHGELIPDFALLDPTLPAAMPPELTAGTGLDVLAHAADAVLCPAANDLTDAIALRAIQMIFKYLPRACRDGRDREARYKMHLASYMAGIVLSQAGSGITHSMGHAVGAVFHIHHGMTVGLMLPYEIEAYSYVSDKYLEICGALGVRARDNRTSLLNLVKKIRALMKEVGVPISIKGFGVSKKDFDAKFEKLVSLTMSDPANVIPGVYLLTADQYRTIYRHAYTGRDLNLDTAL